MPFFFFASSYRRTMADASLDPSSLAAVFPQWTAQEIREQIAQASEPLDVDSLIGTLEARRMTDEQLARMLSEEPRPDDRPLYPLLPPVHTPIPATPLYPPPYASTLPLAPVGDVVNPVRRRRGGSTGSSLSTPLLQQHD